MYHYLKQSFIFIFWAILIWSCSEKPSNKNEQLKSQISINDSISIFTWTTELCENIGKYNSSKYSVEQLKNTFDLWFTFSGIALETDGIAWNIKDISKMDTTELVNDYRKKKKHFDQINIVNTIYWEKLKQLRIQELENEFELKKITIQAYKDASILKSNRFSKHCPDFVRALTSKDTSELISFWKRFAKKQSLKHGSPMEYMDRFYEMFNSEDRLDYARLDLMSFGWYNCANSNLTRISRDNQMEEEFNKLFSDIKTKCYEP